MNRLSGAQDGAHALRPGPAGAAKRLAATGESGGNRELSPVPPVEPSSVGWTGCRSPFVAGIRAQEGRFMNSIIYLIGLIVVVLAILSFLGLR